MDVFKVHEQVIADYRAFTSGFVEVRDSRIKEFVEDQFEQGVQWPDPWLSLNPSFATGGAVPDLVAEGLLHPETARIFRRKDNRQDPGREPIVLHQHQHQREAIEAARTGQSARLRCPASGGEIRPQLTEDLGQPLGLSARRRSACRRASAMAGSRMTDDALIAQAHSPAEHGQCLAAEARSSASSPRGWRACRGHRGARATPAPCRPGRTGHRHRRCPRARLGLTGCVPIARVATAGTVPGMSYPSDLTDDQWALLEPVFNVPSKRGRKHADDLRTVVDAMLYIAQTGCQWRYLPVSFGPWTRVWSQFRRWSRNGTWAQALTVLHQAARIEDERTEEKPSMVVIDTHLARGASNGGFTFHDRGGPYGRTKGAKRVVAVDVTGLPVGALVVPASTHENRASELMLEHLRRQGVTDRLELVLVDRGVTAAAARNLGQDHGLEVRRVGWDDKQPAFRPIRQAWRVEVAHGRLGRSRRLAKSFENTTTSATGWLQVSCIATTLRHLSRERARRRPVALAA